MGSATTVLRELNSEGLLETDGLPNDIKYYPAAVVDEDGYCVGIVTGPEYMIPLIVNEEKFYGQSTGGSSGNGGSGDSGNGGSGSGTRRRDIEPDEPNEPDGPDEPDGPVNSLKDNVIYIGIGIAIAVVLMLVFFNRKKQDQKNGQAPEEVQEPIYPGNVGPTGPIWEDIGPTGPILRENENVNFEEQTPPPTQEPQVYLMAVGGCMDGRRYPVGKNGVTIGRYKSNVISYPEGTPGVSRTHAKLYWDGRELMLMDCNSTSGTYLKRVGLLQPMSPVEVNCGDIFYIGEKKNGFEIKK